MECSTVQPKPTWREASERPTYKRKIEDHCSNNNNMRQVWRGVQHLTHCKSSSTMMTEGDAAPEEKLSHFFARFETEEPEAATARPLNCNNSNFTVQEQTSKVFTKTSNESLSRSFIPPCLKSTTVVPLPERTIISCLNDCLPVYLTPAAMKCFKKLVLHHIMSCLP